MQQSICQVLPRRWLVLVATKARCVVSLLWVDAGARVACASAVNHAAHPAAVQGREAQ